MVRDVVCGMEFNPEDAEGTSRFAGETFYFCSEQCKKSFDENPELYVTTTERG